MKRPIAFVTIILVFIFCGIVEAREPQSVEECMAWLQSKSKEMIPASRCAMKDGTAAFPPQVGGGYDAFWLRDYAYMVEGCSEAFSDKELTDACRVFVGGQRADGACVDCIKFDGTPIYKPGFGSMGDNPVADGSQFTVAVVWLAFQRTKDAALAKKYVDPLIKAMSAVPRNAGNGLVQIKPGGYDRCPYGFTDTVRKQGDELFTSLLYFEAARQLADLLDAAERTADAKHWRVEADRVAASVRTVFWDANVGLFRAATVQCKEPDIWGSAYAVYLGIASKEQASTVAQYFKQHYAEIVCRGQIRHLPGGVYWQVACPKDEYQNGGFWATPTGWFVYTLDLVDPALADRTVFDLVREMRRNGYAEWVFGEKRGVLNYLANVALPIAGIQKMLERRKAVGVTSVVPVVKRELANAAYRLAVQCVMDQVEVTLDDKQAGFRAADGPYFYRAQRRIDKQAATYYGLEGATVDVAGTRLTVRGRLAGVEVEHTFDLPADRPIMEERITVRNGGNTPVAIENFAAGMVRTVTDAAGKVLPEFEADRFVAVPFRAKPDEGKPNYNDFSTADLIDKKGYEIRVKFDLQYDHAPADQRQSEGWAWTHGPNTLGIFKFDQENMQWSVLATQKENKEASLRFGGVSMIDGEPSALGRLKPGQTVKLGVTRYQTFAGGYENAMYAFRSFIDENGCHFPKGFNPPVHWEQLYDMEGAWDDRLHRYTKAIAEKEAEKGVAYSCESLYLDPGWDTGFATFLWGEKWLGPRKAFVEEMKSKYGLKVSLHTPLASWMSINWPMGPQIAPDGYPREALRKAPLLSEAACLNRVPTLDQGRRNLALLPGAKANASSVFADGSNPLHKIPHLNNGWYGNRESWITKAIPGFAEIDLGAPYKISRVRISNDVRKEYSDRKAVNYRILTATVYDADSNSPAWKTVAQISGEPLLGTRDFAFPACDARWVRVQILKCEQKAASEPRLDEIEIYEDAPLAEKDIAAWQTQAQRAPSVNMKSGASTICLGSKAYMDEAAKRLLANCDDGVVYLMYDGNWYQGGCDDPTHGHPVPFTKEDHFRTNVELARRIHEKYPNVLIEMHDMLMGGCNPRNTPVYYKYGLPGSYDENWGFELMWNPMDDITSGRARSLYYYNLGCNVPVYLHIDLRKDMLGLPVLWWYASTCRHLGIGGTHKDPKVVAAQQAAMRKYRTWDRYFKRGEFYGINEEIHLHALPEENAFVVNVFNLSDQKRTISGSIPLERLGLKGERLEAGPDSVGALEKGVWTVGREMPPWTAEVFYVRVTK